MSRSRSVVLPLLLATALVGSVAPASLAQDDVTPAAGINADRVDGKDAVSATGKARQRANKLVATNKQGLLPSNILRPLWSLLQGVPAVLADGQVSWGELLGIPADFADGVDNQGITGVKLTQVIGSAVTIGADTYKTAIADCPARSRVTGGGFFSSNPTDFNLGQSRALNAGLASWIVDGSNVGADSLTLTPYAICMSVEPAGAFTTAKKGLLPASVKKAIKQRGH